MQLNLSFILLLTSRQNPPSDSPALVSHLLPFITIGRPPYSKEGQCLANSPTVSLIEQHIRTDTTKKSREPASILCFAVLYLQHENVTHAGVV